MLIVKLINTLGQRSGVRDQVRLTVWPGGGQYLPALSGRCRGERPDHVDRDGGRSPAADGEGVQTQGENVCKEWNNNNTPRASYFSANCCVGGNSSGAQWILSDMVGTRTGLLGSRGVSCPYHWPRSPTRQPHHRLRKRSGLATWTGSPYKFYMCIIHLRVRTPQNLSNGRQQQDYSVQLLYSGAVFCEFGKFAPETYRKLRPASLCSDLELHTSDGCPITEISGAKEDAVWTKELWCPWLCAVWCFRWVKCY